MSREMVYFLCMIVDGKGCGKMTLKEQVIKRVNIMPDEQVRQLLQFADFLFYTHSWTDGAENAVRTQKKCRRNLKGIMPGKAVMAEDFDETPDCFKEYV